MNRLLLLLMSACATAPSVPEPGAPLHISFERVSEGPERAAFETWHLRTPDRTVRLDLVRNDRLFARDYTEHVVDGGVRVEQPEHLRADHAPCYYQGTSRVIDGRQAPDVGRVAVRTCLPDGSTVLEGLIELDGRSWSLHNGLLEVLPGLPADNLEALSRLHPAATQPLTGQLSPPGQPDYVELVMVNDSERVADFSSVVDAAADTAALTNLLATLYADGAFADPLSVVLSGQLSFVGSGPITPVPYANDPNEIDLFSHLNNTILWAGAGLPVNAADHVMVLTGYDLQDSLRGLAQIGTICLPGNSSSVVMAEGSPAYTALTGAHELGHSLGAVHDVISNTCTQSDRIMAASLPTATLATQWSSCSLAEIDAGVLAASCLANVPAASSPGPYCGNGLVETGEQCDCGATDCDTLDPCCDGATCTLQPGATCSALEGCCDNTCQPVPSGLTCRDAVNSDCDSAETCDGMSSTCPDDETEPTGTGCGAGGACYQGTCQDFPTQCAAMSEGLASTYTSTPACDDLIQAIDPCGRLFCASSTGACTNVNSYPVADGSPCGTDQQCLQGSCLPTADLPGGDACPNDPAKTSPGTCGCGVADDDLDQDGITDCIEPDVQLESISGAAGQTVTFQVDNAPVGSVVFIVLGVEGGAIFPPNCPDPLDLATLFIVGSAPAGTDGRVTISRSVPAFASGLTRRVYAVQPGTCGISEPVDFTF